MVTTLNKWFKHTFVCNNSDCDALYEISSKEMKAPACFEPECQLCGYRLNLISVIDVTVTQGTDEDELSVEDVTISQGTDDNQEEQEMIDEDSIKTDEGNYSPNQIVTYKSITDEGTEFLSAKVTTIEGYLDEARQSEKTVKYLRDSATNSQRTQANQHSSLKEHILEQWQRAYEDEKESLRWIADLFGITLDLTISFTARVEITGQYEADIDYSEGDLEMFLSDELEIFGRGSTEVNNWEIQRVDEDEG